MAGEQGQTRGSIHPHPHPQRQCLPPLSTRVHAHEACARQWHVHDRQLSHHLGASGGGGLVLAVQHGPSAESVERTCVPSFVASAGEHSKLRRKDLGGVCRKERVASF